MRSTDMGLADSILGYERLAREARPCLEATVMEDGMARKVSALCAAAALALGISAGPAFGWNHEPPPQQQKQHCNSGNGNGSDPLTFVVGDHCTGGDSGNSFNG